MKYHKYIILYASLLSLLLLIGQFSVLVHAEEHLFHDAHESCEVFASVEQTDSTLLISSINLPVFNYDPADISFIIFALAVSQNVYQARAPPFLS